MSPTGAARRLAPWWVAAFGVFALLCTGNAAGYRFGVSDQAFYIPAVIRALDPAAFPRDRAVIDAQGSLMILDEGIAALLRVPGVSIEWLFLAGYLLSLALLWGGLVLIGNRVYTNPWLTAALGVAFTLRHRIPRTSANSFEAYFHPRMLAFGVGVLAIAVVLRQRRWVAVALVAATALVHVTTGLWFAVLVGVALAILDRQMRLLAVAGIAGLTAAGAWAVVTGRLSGAFTPMDAIWLRAVASKDSLFATDWPLWAWFANLGLLALLWWAQRTRQRAGVASAEDRALVWGAVMLVAVFLVTLPLVAAGLSRPVQLQISRVFWLVDFVTLIYVLGAIAAARPTIRPAAIAALLLVVSGARGTYIMLVERPDRALFAVHTPASAWADVMRWVSRQPIDIHVLADPGHAWKHGTSVRVSGARDVFLEEVKDSALAIYSRDVAARVVERTAALGDFGAMTTEHASALAKRYELDYVIIEHDLALPVAYRNQQFRVYSLAPDTPVARDGGTAILATLTSARRRPPRAGVSWTRH